MAGAIDEVRLFNFAPELQHVRYLYFIPEGPLPPIVNPKQVPVLAVTEDKIGDEAITNEKIVARAITADKIRANAVTADAIMANAIVTGKIAAGAVVANNIGANQVIASHILSSNILTKHLQAFAVTTEKIAARAITADKIAVGVLRVGTNGNVIIDDNGIVANMIRAGAITADKIAAGSLFVGTNGNVVINDDGITANMLSANSVNLGSATVFGTLTADHIDADVFNVVKLHDGRTMGDAGGSFTGWFSLGRHDDYSTYDMILIQLSANNIRAGAIATANGLSFIVSIDTAKAVEFQMRWNNQSGDRADLDIRFRDHVEAFAGSIGSVHTQGVWGIRSPNRSVVSGPDGTQPTKLSSPSNLRSTEVINGASWRVRGLWDTVPNAQDYLVTYEYKTKDATTWGNRATLVATGTSIELDDNLPSNNDYRFSVVARSTSSSYSNSDESTYQDSVGTAIVPNAEFTLSVVAQSGGGKEYTVDISNLSGIEWEAEVRHGSSGFTPIASDETASSRTFTTGTSYFTSISVRVRLKSGTTTSRSWVIRTWTYTRGNPSYSLNVSRSSSGGKDYTISGLSVPTGLTWEAEVRHGSSSSWSPIESGSSSSSGSFTTGESYFGVNLAVRVRWRNGVDQGTWITRSWAAPMPVSYTHLTLPTTPYV